jgi:hypothetical protein
MTGVTTRCGLCPGAIEVIKPHHFNCPSQFLKIRHSSTLQHLMSFLRKFPQNITEVLRYQRLQPLALSEMGEYITAQGPIPQVLGDETTRRNLEFINELRVFEISGLDLPQVSPIRGYQRRLLSQIYQLTPLARGDR